MENKIEMTMKSINRKGGNSNEEIKNAICDCWNYGWN